MTARGVLSRRRRVVAASWLATLLLVGDAARAWDSDYAWDAHVVGFKVNPSNRDISDAAAVAAIRASAAAWTAQTAAAFRFRYDGTSTDSTFALDGKNRVLFRDERKPTSSTARATTYKWMLGGKIIEADIVFWDEAVSFTSTTLACAGQLYLEDVATHEFGHALGLEHVAISDATMNSGSPSCSKARISLAADDKAGALALYPCAAASECDDADLCTKDSCSNGRCLRKAIAGCCTANAQCDDGDPCTKDRCTNNSCEHSASAGCCTTDAQCDDGKPCTKDRCVGNACQQAAIAGCCTAAAQCGDGDPCTEDRCAANVCHHAPVAGCCGAGCDGGGDPDAAGAASGSGADGPDAGRRASDGPLPGAIAASGDARGSDAGVGEDRGGGGGLPARGAAPARPLAGGCALGASAPAAPDAMIVGALLALLWLRRGGGGQTIDTQSRRGGIVTPCRIAPCLSRDGRASPVRARIGGLRDQIRGCAPAR